MGRKTARAPLGAVLLVAILLAATGTSTVPARPATADAPALALCIEDTTRVPAAVRRAAAELDTVDEVAATYHRGIGCAHHADVRVLRARQTDLPPETAGYATLQGIVLNRGGHFATFTAHERYLVALHELTHIVLPKPPGPDWDGMHTRRCDSILSQSGRCIFHLTGLTDYDRAQIARTHDQGA